MAAQISKHNKNVVHEFFFGNRISLFNLSAKELGRRQKKHITLFLRVMHSAIVDLDWAYLDDGLDAHCALLNLNYEAVRVGMLRIMEHVSKDIDITVDNF